MRVFLAFLLFLSLVPASAGSRAEAAKPPRVDIVVVETDRGAFPFAAEIADTPELRERGLMFRHRLPPHRAMLFNWDRVQPVSMWMRNTNISLDMVFIALDGRVVKVAENTEPHSLDLISSGEPVAAVLEVVAGTARRIGLEAGDYVRHQSFAQP